MRPQAVATGDVDLPCLVVEATANWIDTGTPRARSWVLCSAWAIAAMPSVLSVAVAVDREAAPVAEDSIDGGGSPLVVRATSVVVELTGVGDVAVELVDDRGLGWRPPG